MSKLLVDGRIPKNTECPFTTRCEFKKAGDCKHLGKEHTVDFSCATARLFDLLQSKSRV